MTSGRAQSAPLAVLLLTLMVLSGMSLIVVIGGQALQDARETVDQQRVEKIMTEIDSKSALVALGSTDRQRVSLSSSEDGKYTVDEQSGWLRVTIINQTDGTTAVNTNVSLGSLVYENDAVEIAYQGGGVWRQQRDDVNTTRMVSPPEFHYRNGSLTLPIVSITGDGSGNAISGAVTITKNGTTNTTFPNASLDKNWENPLDNHKVIVSVGGDYYRGWGTFFEQRTNGEVEYAHGDDVVNLTLLTSVGRTQMSTGLSANSAGSELYVIGSARQICSGPNQHTVYTNSYNSTGTTNDYCTQYANGNTEDKGNLTYGDDVHLQSAGGSPIHGTVKSGGEITFGSNSWQDAVHNDIFWDDGCTDHDGGSDCEQYLNDPSQDKAEAFSGVDASVDISNHVQSTVDDIDADNDGTFGSIDADETISGPGRYYADAIELGSGETLELDTSGGNVTLAVEDYVDVNDGGTIEVTGSKTAKIYVNGTEQLNSGGDGSFMEITGDGKVTVPDQNAPQLYVYGNESFNVSLSGSGSNTPVFEGAIYAPAGPDGKGHLNITTGRIVGGIVTGSASIDDANIIFDQALGDQQAVEHGAKVVAITYLHISVNRINATSG